MTTPQELAYYLQGFFEITDAKVLTTDQVKKIKDKVASCFEKVTKSEKSEYIIKIDPSLNPEEEDHYKTQTIEIKDKIPDEHMKTLPEIFFGKSFEQDTPKYFGEITPSFGPETKIFGEDSVFQNPFQGAPQCAADPSQQFLSC